MMLRRKGLLKKEVNLIIIIQWFNKWKLNKTENYEMKKARYTVYRSNIKRNKKIYQLNNGISFAYSPKYNK